MGQVNVLVGKIGNQIVVEPEWVKLSMSNRDEIVWICNAANFEVDFGSPGNCPFPGWSNGKKAGAKDTPLPSGVPNTRRPGSYKYSVTSPGLSPCDPEVSIKP